MNETAINVVESPRARSFMYAPTVFIYFEIPPFLPHSKYCWSKPLRIVIFCIYYVKCSVQPNVKRLFCDRSFAHFQTVLQVATDTQLNTTLTYRNAT